MANTLETTFDNLMPEFEHRDEVISPLSSLLSQNTAAIQFTYQLFLTRPELFGENAETLVYAQYAGHRFKPASYYNIYEVFIKQTNRKLIQDKRTGKYDPNNPFKYDADYIITWARIIQRNQLILEFEPVMRQLKNILNDWFANPMIEYGGSKYPLSFFRPLCYNYSGENITSLIPYIAYLFTFFIYCYPYEFDEGQSESSVFGFYKAVDDWYMKHYIQLAEDTGIDVIKGDLTDLAKIADKYWVDMLNHMLNTVEIIRLRNEEIERTPSLLDQCISDQNACTVEKIRRGFNDVLTNLIKLTVANSPVKKIFNAIPQFNPKHIDTTELMMLTQYCLAGGDQPFIVEPEIDAVIEIPNKLPNYSYLLHGDPECVQPYPKEIIGKQHLPSHIKPFHHCIHRPFSASDFNLECLTAYIRQEFEQKQTDILDDNPIAIDESMLRDNLYPLPLANLIANLFVNGLWMYDNSSMCCALKALSQNRRFASEISDILSLTSVCQVCYNNRQASILVTPLILSYLNTELLDNCLNDYLLQSFSPMTYVCLLDVPSPNRIKKLVDMLTSLLYIANPLYDRFVQMCVNDFSQLLLTNPIIQQVYVKGLDDAADIYAIGGCELYNYSHFSNPLIRGYGWVINVFGNCEQIETFYKWIYNLDNTALFQVINDSLNNVEVIEVSLKAQWVKMIGANRIPKLLSNWTFSEKGYIMKNVPYFLDLQTSDNEYILSLLCKYTYPYSNPRRSISRQIIFREIEYKRLKLKVHRPVPNGMISRVHDSRDNAIRTNAEIRLTGTAERLPVYDYNGSMEDISIIYSAPRGRRVVKLLLFNSRYIQNSTVWFFTPLDRKTRFQKYVTLEDDLQNRKGIAPAVAQKMYPDRADVVRTRAIKDYLAKMNPAE